MGQKEAILFFNNDFAFNAKTERTEAMKTLKPLKKIPYYDLFKMPHEKDTLFLKGDYDRKTKAYHCEVYLCASDLNKRGDKFLLAGDTLVAPLGIYNSL